MELLYIIITKKKGKTSCISQERQPCLPGLTWLPVVSELKALSWWPQRTAAPMANLPLITVVLPHGTVMCRDYTHKTEQTCWWEQPCKHSFTDLWLQQLQHHKPRHIWEKFYSEGYQLSRGPSKMIFTGHRGQGGKEFWEDGRVRNTRNFNNNLACVTQLVQNSGISWGSSSSRKGLR